MLCFRLCYGFIEALIEIYSPLFVYVEEGLEEMTCEDIFGFFS
jgi:hypothetical protein